MGKEIQAVKNNNVKEKYRNNIRDMAIFALATIALAIASGILIFTFGLDAIVCILVSCSLTVLFAVYFTLSVLTAVKTKKELNTSK